MSDGLKPLIFLAPLSETLVKLKEVFEENAESEGVELYDLDDLEEAAQLIPNIGQSLVLSASPKKCAMMLQQNRKAIKTLQTKTILLSPKAIPRKTLDKFMKVGLTECVIEPVNPKTLLYKVRLQLRSIKTASEDDGEMNQKFGEDGGQKAAEGPSKKIRSSQNDADPEGEEEVKTKKGGEEVVLEDYSKPTRKKYEEESIDNYYKGKQKKKNIEEAEEEEAPEKKAYQEEVIDGHYKGKVKQALEVEVEQEEEEAPTLSEMEEDIESLKHKINLEVEEDLAAKNKKEVESFEEEEALKKKAQVLAVEEDDERSETDSEDVEDLGGHYKGKVGKKLDVEEEEEFLDKKPEEEVIAEAEKKKKLALEVEDEAPDYIDKEEDEVEQEASAKKKPKLDLVEEEEEKELVQKAVVEEDEEEGPSIEVEDVEGSELESPKPEKLAVVDDEDKDELENAKADEIDGYLRGGKAKKVQVEEDGEDLYAREESEVENQVERNEKTKLDIEEDGSGEEPYIQEAEELNGKSELEKKDKLSVVDDEDSDLRNQSDEDDEEQEKDLLAKNKLDVVDDPLKRKSLAQKEELNDPRNRSDARADHIKTHYSSKESTKHNDDNWDAKWDKKKKEEDDFPKEKREEKSLNIESEDLGEQTIDYAQLKKEFAAGSYDGTPNKKKVYGEFHEVAEVKTFTKTVLGVEGSPEQMEFEEISREQKEGLEGAQVFEPISLGIEIAIQVQGYYLEEDVDSYKICEFIQERISSEFSGDLVVYKNAKGDSIESFFNGRVVKQLGRPPVKLTDLDLEGLSRSERRERELEYEEDFKAYDLQKREVELGYNQSWGNKLDQWKEYKTPAFRDHTFQELQNEFVFPFYEGVTMLGIAIFIPTTKFNAERSESLEVIYEVIRGLLLTEYHQERGATEVRKKEVKPEEKKSGGFFNKLFGKKAG